MLVKFVLASILTAFLFSNQIISEEILLDDGVEDSPLSKSCLRCLCMVMGCLSEGCVGNTCGMFRITLGYWEAAHQRPSFIHNNVTEYESCSNNVWCAVRTVQRYMRRYLPNVQTLRPDRLLCENALALHKFGFRRGHHNLTDANYYKLYSCLHRQAMRWLDTERF